jgi:hypothetical protein
MPKRPFLSRVDRVGLKRLAQTVMSAGASMQFGTEWRFSGLPKAGLWRVFRLVKKNDIFAKMMLTHLVGWPYNPLTQRGRRAAGAKKFALV